MLALEVAELRVELKWTRRAVVVLLAIQGGDLAARLGPFFS